MTNYNLKKDRRGNWGAESLRVLENVTREGKPAQRVLKLSTYKRSSGQLSTYASVHIEQDGTQCHAIFGDFSKNVRAEKVRATEKGVRLCHEAALRDFDRIEADARAFYASRPAGALAVA